MKVTLKGKGRKAYLLKSWDTVASYHKKKITSKTVKYLESALLPRRQDGV